jgi:hypothetical protein
MAIATIHLAPDELMESFFFHRQNAHSIALSNLESYQAKCWLEVLDMTGENVAEEVFDLTNNPCRQDERERVYGRGRSVSVGDIVDVDGTMFFCAPVGWMKLVPE